MRQRLEFFDTNVLVAASLPLHVHHLRANALLSRLQHGGAACASHSLAETYSTLTNPRKYGIPPNQVAAILEHAARTYTLVALNGKETLSALKSAAQLNLFDGMVYDALLMACARKVGATAIYTNNAKHFRLVAPDLASLIREP
jgi:predicted nucleic acid-binding protein